MLSALNFVYCTVYLNLYVACRPRGRNQQRRVVLATPIAESSITIDGVTAVVDCGLCRSPRYDPATGISRLVTQRIALDSAEQRRGRAGRTQPGKVYLENRLLHPFGLGDLLQFGKSSYLWRPATHS